MTGAFRQGGRARLNTGSRGGGVGPGVGGALSVELGAAGACGAAPDDGGGAPASARPSSPGRPCVRPGAARREPTGSRQTPVGPAPSAAVAQRRSVPGPGPACAGQGLFGPGGGFASWASLALAPVGQGAAGAGLVRGAASPADILEISSEEGHEWGCALAKGGAGGGGGLVGLVIERPAVGNTGPSRGGSPPRPWGAVVCPNRRGGGPPTTGGCRAQAALLASRRGGVTVENEWARRPTRGLLGGPRGGCGGEGREAGTTRAFAGWCPCQAAA